MSDGIAELLKELQKTYLESLPAKISALRELWQKKDLKLLKTDFHKLKGTGRTYGLNEVTLVGEALEKLCLPGEEAKLNEAVPLALDLLHEIGVERAMARVPEIESDQRFQRILQLVASLEPIA